jgi:hypothetical protein
VCIRLRRKICSTEPTVPAGLQHRSRDSRYVGIGSGVLPGTPVRHAVAAPDESGANVVAVDSAHAAVLLQQLLDLFDDDGVVVVARHRVHQFLLETALSGGGGRGGEASRGGLRRDAPSSVVVSGQGRTEGVQGQRGAGLLSAAVPRARPGGLLRGGRLGRRVPLHALLARFRSGLHDGLFELGARLFVDPVREVRLPEAEVVGFVDAVDLMLIVFRILDRILTVQRRSLLRLVLDGPQAPVAFIRHFGGGVALVLVDLQGRLGLEVPGLDGDLYGGDVLGVTLCVGVFGLVDG